MSEPNKLLRTIFNHAVELADAEQRADYLAVACRDNPVLRQQVEALIGAHEAAGKFLGTAGDTLPSETSTAQSGSAGQPGDHIGRYKLLQQIGEGGCGVVFMAEQTEPMRRRVALKVIKLGMDTKSVIARFEAERQALALMDHPNIAKVLDAGATDAGRPYFVMELVKGVRITDYCDQNNLPTAARLDLFMQVCHAIQHAHQKGIIHRDIKPSNILVTLHDGVPVPKVIDFGIAKATSDQRLTDKTLFTAFEQFMGTPAYMSPEQAEMSGLDIDTRSDIYALGVLLYELLTGKPPFDGRELMASGLDAMRRTIREQEPAKPSTRLSTMLAADLTTVAKHRQCDSSKLTSAIRGDLDWIVMKALEKDRTRRYETSSGLAADIQRHLDNEAVTARPAGNLYRFQKLVRRNKLAFAAAGAVTLALVGGTLVSLWQASVATRERKVAETAQASETKQRLAAQAAQRRAEADRRQAEAQRQRAEAGEYVANMRLAQQAWEQNNLGRVRQLLEESAPYPERGFEWYYWQRQSHAEIRTLRGHGDNISSVAFSPDGQRIVTGSWDHTAKVWEAATGKELLTLKGHSNRIQSVAISPGGQRIVTGSDDRTAKVWDAVSGKELLTFRGHRNTIWSGAFSPDGNQIVTGSEDRTAKVWEVTTGRQLLSLEGHKAEIRSAAFSPDSRWILTGSWDQTAKVWEAATGKELVTLKGHSDGIRSAAFSPDGQRIVTGSYDHTAKVWEAATGKELLTFRNHSFRINAVAFSPDGLRIISGGGKPVISPVSAGDMAKVWEAATGKELLTLKGQPYGIVSVAFSPDGQRILTGSEGKPASVWETASGLEILTLNGHGSWVDLAAFLPDGQRIVTSCEDRTAKVWEAVSGKELFTFKGHSNDLSAAAFSPDGKLIVTSGRDLTAKVCEMASGKALVTLTGHKDTITCAAFSPDGQRIATGSYDQTVKVWEATTGKELLTFTGHSGVIANFTPTVLCVAFSSDGRRIVSGSQNNTAKVWETATGKELLTLRGHSNAVWSVTFSLDGNRIVTGSDDRTAKVWEAFTGKELLTLRGHSALVTCVALSPDGRRIVTGSYDQTARLWEVTNGKELLILKGHSDGILSVAFSPDGQRIITGSKDQTVKVWATAAPQQVATWQQAEKAAAERNSETRP